MNSEHNFEKRLQEAFQGSMPEADFVKRTYESLNKFGFNANNSIACVGICRDEISQSFFEEVNRKWGYAFNLSSLAGMLFLGRTGFMAAEHHSPDEEGKERYIFFAMPHIAIDSQGQIGVCVRKGRKGESSACGALVALQKEISDSAGQTDTDTDTAFTDDIEMSLIRMRLSKEIPSDIAPDLFELTKITQKAIEADLERMISLTVNTDKSDYAIITGIQIHGPEVNYVWPVSCYVVMNGIRQEITLK